MLSILAAASMPVGKVGAQPASATTGKQSALPMGAEPAVSESSGAGSDSAETKFQQAFSSALRDSPAPVHGNGKLASGIVPQATTEAHAPQKAGPDAPAAGPAAGQTPINGTQLLATVNLLLSDILSSLPAPVRSASKTPGSTPPVIPKEQPTSKSKTPLLTEPVAPKADQTSVDGPNAALLSSVAGAFAARVPEFPVAAQSAVPSESAGLPDQVSSAATPLSVRDLPSATAAPASAAPAQAPAAEANAAPLHSSVPSTPDSLSFALLLHPKLAQGPITSTQSIPVVKQVNESRSNAPANATLAVDQTTGTPDTDSKLPVAPVPPENVSIPAAQPVGSARTEFVAADPSQARSPSQAATASGTQQPSTSSGAAFQIHASQNSSSSDQPPRGKTESASDGNSAALTGLSDIAKPVIVATNMVSNTTAAHAKTAEPVAGAPLTAQVLNEHNHAVATPAKEVVVRLQGQTGEAISVRLLDQGGQVQVAVRSSDPATASLLRQDLSSLTNNLDRAGWKPEILSSAPVAASFVPETSQGSAHDGQNPSGQGQGQAALDWNQQDSSRRRSTVADLWDEILTRQGT